MNYTLSVTLHKYQNHCQIYRNKRNKFYNSFSQASRLRLVKLINCLPYHINKPDNNYYLWSD